MIAATHCNLREMIERHAFREDLYYRLNGLAVRLPALRERSDLMTLAQRMLKAECPAGAPRLSERVMAYFKDYHWPGNLRQLSNVLRTAAVMAAGEPLITDDHLSDDFLEDVRRLRRAAVAVPAAVSEARAPTPALQPTVQAPRQERFDAEVDDDAAFGSYGMPEGTAAHAAVPTTAAPMPAPLPSAFAPPAPASAKTLGEHEIDMIRAALDAAGGNISVASKRLGISRNTIYRKLRWNQP